jgi:putative transposase
MRDWQSQPHVKWYGKYHVVFIPKYRRKTLYGVLRRDIGEVLRELCRQTGVEIVEGHAMPDHIHPMLEHSAEVQRGAHGRVSQRQISDPEPSP